MQTSGSTYTPTAIPQILEEYFHQLLYKAQQIRDPFEQAFFVITHLPYLQPFDDVNKRTARIGANIAFIKHNFCSLTFVDVPEPAYVEATLPVKELRNTDLLRDMFVCVYERSTQRHTQVKKTLAEPSPTRLKYRETIDQLVGDIVRSGKVAFRKTVEQAADAIQEADRKEFIALVMDELKRLHEGGSGTLSNHSQRISTMEGAPMKGFERPIVIITLSIDQGDINSPALAGLLNMMA